ncbi:LEA type 2 family protein [Xanthomonas translucens]|uniref:NDR1/HIN1-like protein n=1 Tax=Xanthomonas campestris pv. translucens TaxID=343 RepID=UPI001654BC1B|nr:LEA type 2 family protein [Xanthomonas translucens]MBC3972393.1 LEA type 2 family protein [Xanthomonas translucens pv. undulosa]
MRQRLRFGLLVLCAALLAACGDGMVRRVSDPAASLQQLTVNMDGSWKVELRLQNYSSITMRYDRVRLDLGVGGAAPGTLQLAPAISIGPETADVVSAALRPSSAARLAVADALAGRRSLDYTLKGSIDATPEQKKQRKFEIDTRNMLNPAPGLDGVLR